MPSLVLQQLIYSGAQIAVASKFFHGFRESLKSSDVKLAKILTKMFVFKANQTIVTDTLNTDIEEPEAQIHFKFPKYVLDFSIVNFPFAASLQIVIT